MRIFFTVNLAIQYSLILNQQNVQSRLLSFVHFQDGGKAELAYYAEHGHFEPGEKSKYKDGLLDIEPTKEPQDDNRKPRRSAVADDSRSARTRNSILHPGVDPHQVRRRIRDDVQ